MREATGQCLGVSQHWPRLCVGGEDWPDIFHVDMEEGRRGCPLLASGSCSAEDAGCSALRSIAWIPNSLGKHSVFGVPLAM